MLFRTKIIFPEQLLNLSTVCLPVIRFLPICFLSVCLSVCLCVCPSVYQSNFPSYRLSIFPPLHLAVCLSVCLFVCLFNRPSVSQSASPTFRLFVFLFVHLCVFSSDSLSISFFVLLSACLSVWLSISLSGQVSICPHFVFLSLHVCVFPSVIDPTWLSLPVPARCCLFWYLQ